MIIETIALKDKQNCDWVPNILIINANVHLNIWEIGKIYILSPIWAIIILQVQYW